MWCLRSCILSHSRGYGGLWIWHKQCKSTWSPSAMTSARRCASDPSIPPRDLSSFGNPQYSLCTNKQTSHVESALFQVRILIYQICPLWHLMLPLRILTISTSCPSMNNFFILVCKINRALFSISTETEKRWLIAKIFPGFIAYSLTLLSANFALLPSFPQAVCRQERNRPCINPKRLTDTHLSRPIALVLMWNLKCPGCLHVALTSVRT